MDRIALRNDQQTTIAIAFSRKGKTVAEPGDTVRVASSAATVLNATFNPETGLIDVVPIDDALGPSDVVVTVTLADGVVLPAQSVGFDIIHPDADAVVLSAGEIVDKTTSIRVPRPNPDPVVILPPEPAPVQSSDKVETKDTAETKETVIV